MEHKNQEIKVVTSYTPDGFISQETFVTGSMFGEIMRCVVDTREAHIKKALLELGWTSPRTEESKQAWQRVKKDIRGLCECGKEDAPCSLCRDFKILNEVFK